MLVLARRLGETIIIGGDIRITVVETNGACIRLGIDAPRNVLVDRQEVHERRMEFTEALAAPRRWGARVRPASSPGLASDAVA
jgi:carbon storage regulator